MNRKIKFYLLTVITFSILSCNESSLSRGKAKDKINEFSKAQNLSYLKGFETINAVIIGAEYYKVNMEDNKLTPYIKNGLLEFKKRDERPNTVAKTWDIYEITEEGRKYLLEENWDKNGFPVYKVKLYDAEIDEILGIRFSDGNKEAIVDYSIKFQNMTPFINPIMKSNSNKLLQALFILYDDGWRVQSISSND